MRRTKMRGFMPWVKPLVVVGIIVIILMIAIDTYDTVSHNCKPNGEQRFSNTIDGIVVEDKLICDGGRVKWSRN